MSDVPFAGRHVLAELTGIRAELLVDEPALRAALTRALAESGATVLDVVAHRFEPPGLTVLALLAESHASVHTWPDRGGAFVDVFTCGAAADPERAVDLLAAGLGASRVDRRTIHRGAGEAARVAEIPRVAERTQVTENPRVAERTQVTENPRVAERTQVTENPRVAERTQVAEKPRVADATRATETTRVVEPLAAGLHRVWDVSEMLWTGRTAYQDVLVGRTAHGVTLFCDGERQSAEASQLLYHEALLLPALLLADQVRDVLVIGSSEGVVSEIAVAAGARRVDHVDIDAECVRVCARRLPYGYSPEALAAAERGDGPVHVRYEDGWRFLAAAERRYDIVVVDLPDERPDDPAAQHNRLYGVDFLRRAAGVLAPGGVLVGQAGCATLWRNETLLTSVDRFEATFATVVHYGSDEHEWSFLTGALTPIADPVARMTGRLATLPYRPATLDAAALRRGAVLPHATRR